MQRTFAILLSALAFSLPVTQADTQPVEHCDIVAHLTRDGKPAAGVGVELMRESKHSSNDMKQATANAQGEVRFSGVDYGQYRLNAWDGHRSLLSGKLTAAKDASAWNIELLPAPRLQLRVLRPDGKPAAGSACRLTYYVNYVSSPKIGKRQIVNGNYSLGQICQLDGKGEYSLEIDDWGTLQGMTVTALGVGCAVYYKHIELAPGSVRPITTHLKPAGTVQFRFVEDIGQADGPLKVTSTATDPGPIAPGAVAVGGVSLSLANDSLKDPELEYHPPQFSEDGTGKLFYTDLMPGHYVASLYNRDSKTNPPLPFHFDVKSGSETFVTCSLKPRHAPTLHLKVQDSSGNAVANRRLFLRVLPGQGELGTSYPLIAEHPFTTDAAGNATLYPLPQGKYRLDLTLPAEGEGMKYSSGPLTVEIPAEGLDLRMAIKE